MHRGFTLIELMVSVTIFIVVMTISLGALLSMSASDRKAESVKTVMNNLNFALESMTRTIRTGYSYGCGTTEGVDCETVPQSRIVFTAANGNVISYCLGSSGTSCSGVSGTVCTDAGGCSILRSVEGAAFEPLTAPEVKVVNLAFYVQGSAPGSSDNLQPRIIMTLDGLVVGAGATSTAFQLQTSVTQRLYDQ